MELEKIISTIFEKAGKTDVSKETVTTLVGLYPLQDGFEPDEAYFDKMVKAVKSVQGNVNNVMSTKVTEQVKAKVAEELSKRTQKPKEKPEEDPTDISQWAKELKELKEQFENDRKEWQHEKAEREKKNLLDSVKKGLEKRFEAGGLKLNGFFAKSALSKLDITDGETDVDKLIDAAEKLYNADLKEAGIESDTPRSTGAGGSRGKRNNEDEWDDVAKAIGRGRPKQEE
jgi:membrane-associated HD superfamily phosphohydrolase